MKKTTKCLAILIGAFLCMSATGFSLITFDAALLIPEPVEWYDATAGQFQLENLGGTTSIQINAGDLRVAGLLTYDYAFDGTIVITPSDKLGIAGDDIMLDNKSGAVVSTMTIYAERVYEKATGTDIIGTPVTLLVAEMTQTPWFISEDSLDPAIYRGTTQYEMVSGELIDGPVVRMYDFSATYKMNNTSPVNGGFSQDMTSANPQITLSAPVPEPATMLMLGLGTVLAYRRKK